MNALRVVRARTFSQRLLGWMGRTIPPDECLLLEPCGSVHTFFMRGPIDVAFIHADGHVLRTITLPAWRTARQRGARMVLELPAGACSTLSHPAIEALVTEARNGARPQRKNFS